jgi:hypothetical protein
MQSGKSSLTLPTARLVPASGGHRGKRRRWNPSRPELPENPFAVAEDDEMALVKRLAISIIY